MSRIGTRAARWLRVVCACVLVVAGAWGLARSLAASAAQISYKRAKYGFFAGTRLARRPITDPRTVLRLCERAHALYAHDYYFPVYASDRALGGALAATDYEEFRRLFGAAEHWNRVSVALNPYNIDAMHVACRLLREKGDMAGAITFWRDVVLEREFWNPDHHETLVDLYLKAGETSKAVEAAGWLRSGPLRRKVRLLEEQRKRALAPD